MLVERDQCACHNADQCISGHKTKADVGRTESCRCQQREDDAIAWPVALEHLALDQRLASVRPQLLPNLLLCLSEGQRLGLSEEIGEENTVVEGVTDRVEGGGGSDEIGRDQLGSLVNKLIERVLTIGSGSTPDDGLEYHANQQPPRELSGTKLTPVW